MIKRITILFMLLFMIAGCGYNNEQKNELKEYRIQALNYLEKKYGNYQYIVKSVNYDTSPVGNGVPISKYNNDVIIEIEKIIMNGVKYDGCTVFYDSQTNRFLDNFQSKTINDAVKNKIFDEIFFGINYKSFYESTSYYNNIEIDYNYGLKDSYFTDLYEEDIVTYIDDNDIKIEMDVLVSSIKNNWKNDAYNIYNRIKPSIRDNLTLKLVFCDEYYFNNLSYINYKDEILMNNEHVFGKVNIDENINFIIYEYAKIIDGISMISLTNNLFLKTDDIKILKSNKDINYIQNLCPNLKLSSTYPIYEIKFSDRVVGMLKNSNTPLTIQAKINKDEIFFRKESSFPEFFLATIYYFEEGNDSSGELRENIDIKFDVNKTYYIWAGTQKRNRGE